MEIQTSPAPMKTRVFPPRTLLAPTDFSEASTAACGLARILAQRWESRIELIHVDEGLPALMQGADAQLTQEALRAYYAEADRRLQDGARGLPRCAARMMDGSPYEVVPRLAAGGGADLVVMGTHGHSGVTRFAFGSVAEATVHRAVVPVLTARMRPGGSWPSRILVPMKWTEYADQALLVAQDWAASLGAALTVLHVYEDGTNAAEEEALRSHVLRLLGAKGPAPDWYWRPGRPFEQIVRVAAAGRFDLIVLSAHIRQLWQDVLLGTTAERVLRYSPVPVLSVPSGFKEAV